MLSVAYVTQVSRFKPVVIFLDAQKAALCSVSWVLLCSRQTWLGYILGCSPEACIGVSKGTRSFSLEFIAVTSRLSLMSRDSIACKTTKFNHIHHSQILLATIMPSRVQQQFFDSSRSVKKNQQPSSMEQCPVYLM